MLRNAIFNRAISHIYEKGRDQRLALSSSTKEVLVKHMEDRENVPFVNARPGMDVRVG